MGETITNRMTEGRILPQLMRFSVPFFLSYLFQSLYSVVDMVIVGHYVGSAGITAVTLGGQMSFIITAICVGLVDGGQVIVAQYVGAKDHKSVSATIGTLFSMCFIAGAAMTAIGLALTRPVLVLMDTPAESLEQAVAFMLINCWGTIFIFGYNAVSALLRGMGDAKRPFIFIALASVINILLNYVFVGRMGLQAAGSALATVIGQSAAFLGSIVYLYIKRAEFGFDFRLRSFKINSDKLKRMLKIGIPSAAEMSIVNISFLYMLGMINAYGVAATATYGVGSRIDNLLRMPAWAISSSSCTMIGQNMGARKFDRIKRIVAISFSFALVFNLLFMFIYRAFPQQFFSVFSTDPGVLETAVTYVRISSWGFLCFVLMNVFNAFAKGIGAATLVMIGGILDAVVFRLGFALLLTRTFGLGYEGILFAAMIAPAGASTVSMTYFFSGRWKKKRVIESGAGDAAGSAGALEDGAGEPAPG